METAESRMKRCEHVTLCPCFMKNGVDPSEYTDKRGAFLWNAELSCGLVADPGHKFCPRHEAIELSAASQAAAFVQKASA
jgi:hypothetical protein